MRTPTLILVLAAAGLAGCAVAPQAREDAAAAPLRGNAAANTQQARDDNAKAVDLLAAGKLDEAKTLLDRALVADAMYGPTHNNLGLVYFARGRDYDAAWSFERAAKLMPKQGEPQNNLGLVYERAERLEDAETAYRGAYDLDPQNVEFAGNLARVRVRRGQRDELTTSLLRLVILKDRRPAWVSWARENLHRQSP